jgi:hypothetical protein
MANVLNQNPIIISGTQTSYKAATLASLGSFASLRVTKIYWENPTTVGDQMVIIDPATGRNIFRMRCESANISQIATLNQLWADFAVNELDSGTLYIYLA